MVYVLNQASIFATRRHFILTVTFRIPAPGRKDPVFMEEIFSLCTSRHDYLASLLTAQGRGLWHYLLIPEGSALHILC